ncbi:MAG: hypothetical protein ACTHM6_16405, partial [Tepidisphaeraceae bacterium]
MLKSSMLLCFGAILCAGANAQSTQPAHLPGELSADDVLNGKYPFPPSPAVEWHADETYFAKDRMSAVPPPGVHPRVLISPSDLPGLRKRWKETD